jgi:hypothetical protein
VNPLPQVLPPVNQSVLRGLPFPLFVFNLSIPGFRVQESLDRRPTLPLVHEGDEKQTLINLVLGYPVLILDNPPTWSQAEYADYMAPTFIIVQMGFGDVVEAVVQDDPTRITDPADFERDYRTLMSRLQDTYASVLVMNVPNPLDTAFVVTIAEAAAIYGTTPEDLTSLFKLSPADLITLGGMVEIGNHYAGRSDAELSDRSVLDASLTGAVTAAVDSYNSTIRAVAAESGAVEYDFHGFIETLRGGLGVGSLNLDGSFGGGFYTQDGMYPTATGHAVLANELLTLINSRFNTSYAPVDVEEVSERDPLLKGNSGASDLLLPQPDSSGRGSKWISGRRIVR